MRTPRSLVVAILLVGCSPAPAPPVDESINVVAVLPLTGTFANKGPIHQAAIQMAIRDLEASGGVIGRPFQVFVVDSTSDSDAAAARVAAQLDELRADGRPQVAGIISSTTAAFKGAVAPALAEGIPHVEVSSGSGLDEMSLDAEADPSYEFATRPLCMPEPSVTARFVVARGAQPGWATVAIARGDKGHDRMHTEMFRDALAAEGFTGMVLNSEDVVMPAEPYEPYFEDLLAMQPPPDILYYHLNGDGPNRKFIQAAERTGYQGKLITCGMAKSKELLDPIEPGVADYMSADSTTEGRFFFAMRGPISGDALDRFEVDFSSYSGSTDTFAASAYDAMTLLGLGVAEAGSAVDGTAIRDAIVRVSVGGQKIGYGDVGEALSVIAGGGDLDYDGAASDLDLRTDPVLGHLTIGRYYLQTVVEVEAGKWDYLSLPAPDEQQ